MAVVMVTHISSTQKLVISYSPVPSVASVVDSKPDGMVFIDDRWENIERALQYGWSGVLFPQASPSGAMYLEKLLLQAGIQK